MWAYLSVPEITCVVVTGAAVSVVVLTTVLTTVTGDEPEQMLR